MSHSAVPNRLKVLPVIAFIYMIFPRDLFIDFHPFGLADDLVAVSVLLSIFINKSWKYVGGDGKKKSDAIDADFEVLIHEEKRSEGDAFPDSSRDSDVTYTEGSVEDTPHDDLRSQS